MGQVTEYRMLERHQSPTNARSVFSTERCYAELWQSLISWFSGEPLCGGFRPARGGDEVFAKCAKTSRFARQLIHAFRK